MATVEEQVQAEVNRRLRAMEGGTPDGGSDEGPFLPPGTETNPTTEGTAPPFYLQGFPQFQPIQFPSIKTAPFQFTDPLEFAKKFGEFGREELGKQFGQAQQFGLQALDTELKGLKGFAPAAAALSREQINLDNLFNQQQRTQQLQGTLPQARGDLEAQRRRSLAYAEGRLPDEQLDRALELGLRSRAADQAQFAGFGPKSGQAAKISDLMSAEERFQIGQFGEQLFGQNLVTSANLLLAPTQYSTAGSQIRPTPEVGAGRLTFQALPLIAQQTGLSTAQALQTQVQQQQFGTTLEQQTRMFNAEGTFKASAFNSQNLFTAQLGEFGYNAAYLANVDAANQHVLDQNLAIELQNAQNQTGGEFFNQAQNNAGIKDWFKGIGDIIGLATGGGTETPTPTPAPAPGTTTTTTTTTGPTPEPITTPEVTPISRLTRTEAPEIAPFELASIGPSPIAFDSSVPSGVKFSQGSELPENFVPVANNLDGTISAINRNTYGAELERFAKSNNVPVSELNIQSFAAADRALTDAAGLSYTPVPGFAQVALTSSGRNVYSSPGDAQSGNINIGASNALAVTETTARLGITDPATQDAIDRVGRFSSDPAVMAKLTEAINSAGGIDKFIKEIQNGLIDPGFALDPSSPIAQQFMAGAERSGELWTGLSPYQKSAALSSLMDPAVTISAGKRIADQIIPGTQNSPIGALKVGDAVALTARGQNGYSIARNWDQLSAITDMAINANGGRKTVKQVANLSQATGLTGFGPQGASVPVDFKQLKASGAQAAPEFGVGAMAFRNAADVPKNYKVITTTPDNKVLAIPKNLANTSGLTNSRSPALSFAKTKTIAQGQHPAQRAWGAAATEIIKGSAGGSAVVSGLSELRNTNTQLFGSIAAYSLFNSTMSI